MIASYRPRPVRVGVASTFVLALLLGCLRNAPDVPEPQFDNDLDSGVAVSRPARVIVLIVIDTLRADHVGAYGSILELTPNLDRLANRSFVFENAIATSSWTRSSVASMLTSRYPGSIRVLQREDAIAEEYATLPEILSREGWETFAVLSNGNAGPTYGFDRGFVRWVWPQVERGYPGDFRKVTAEGVTLEALKALDEQERSASRRPFFLFVHYIDPHDPYLPQPGLLPGSEPPGRFSGSRLDLKELDRLPPNERTTDDVDRIKYLYAGEVKYCDGWVGKLVDELDRRDTADQTMIIVTADHGEGLWDHRRRDHGKDLYEEQIHVPLVVRYPGTSERDARRIANPVSLVDIAPTILRSAGIARPTDFEGHDLTPLTRGEARPEALQYIYSELDLDRKNYEAIRNGSSKLIRRRSRWEWLRHGLQVYDLAVDPKEQKNLAHRLTGPPEQGRLRAALDRWGHAIYARAGGGRRVSTSDLDVRTRDQLKALGYIQ